MNKMFLVISLLLFGFSAVANPYCEKLGIDINSDECEMVKAMNIDATIHMVILTGYHDLEQEILLTAYKDDPHTPVKEVVLKRGSKSKEYSILLKYIESQAKLKKITLKKLQFAD